MNVLRRLARICRAGAWDIADRMENRVLRLEGFLRGMESLLLSEARAMHGLMAQRDLLQHEYERLVHASEALEEAIASSSKKDEAIASSSKKDAAMAPSPKKHEAMACVSGSEAGRPGLDSLLRRKATLALCRDRLYGRIESLDRELAGRREGFRDRRNRWETLRRAARRVKDLAGTAGEEPS